MLNEWKDCDRSNRRRLCCCYGAVLLAPRPLDAISSTNGGVDGHWIRLVPRHTYRDCMEVSGAGDRVCRRGRTHRGHRRSVSPSRPWNIGRRNGRNCLRGRDWNTCHCVWRSWWNQRLVCELLFGRLRISKGLLSTRSLGFLGAPFPGRRLLLMEEPPPAPSR